MLNTANSRGNTAPHNAMYRGNVDVVISLLSNGADPTVQNAYGEAVLHLTALSLARIQAIQEDDRCQRIVIWSY